MGLFGSFFSPSTSQDASTTDKRIATGGNNYAAENSTTTVVDGGAIKANEVIAGLAIEAVTGDVLGFTEKLFSTAVASNSAALETTLKTAADATEGAVTFAKEKSESEILSTTRMLAGVAPLVIGAVTVVAVAWRFFK